MSYAIGGRSGNRGECAQPCRRAYDLVDADGRALVRNRHLLSLRDMQRIAYLGELLDAGVTSFKIEGRLKDEVYVTNVVAAYRQALDLALAPRDLKRSSSGRSQVHFSPNLDKTFNRGYTPYFLNGREAPPGSIDTPKMVGEPIGAVRSVSSREVTLDARYDLHPGDGIAFFDEDGVLRGTVINGVRFTQAGVVLAPNAMEGFQVGTTLHRNRDHEFLASVRKSPPERTIGVLFTLSETPDGIKLEVEDEDGIGATAWLKAERVVAHKPQQAMETARQQLERTGGTPFRSEGVILEWTRPLFLTFSSLNELRRQALDELLAAREQARPRWTHSRRSNAVPYPVRELSFRGNALNQKAVAFYRRHGVTEIEPAAESGLNMRGRAVMTTRYCIKEQLGWCPHAGPTPRLAEPLFLVDEAGHRYELRFQCGRYPESCGMDVIY
jgi:putative protease